MMWLMKLWLALALAGSLSAIFLYSMKSYSARPASTIYVKDFKSWESGLVTKLEPVTEKNCPKVFDGDKNELQKLKLSKKNWKNSRSDNDILQATGNCTWVRDYFYNNLYVTKLEQSFPIAFSFLIHDSPQQVLRLLRLLYRPHNQYCIHPDSKSSPDFIKTFKNIAQCLDNVHFASVLRNVSWGHRSIMESLMQCNKDLLRVREQQDEQKKWKYVINLCGKELPLTSNHDIVSHHIKLNGTSMVEVNKPVGWQWTRRLKVKKIPYGSEYYGSSAYMSLSFQFVHYILNNSTAIGLFDFFGANCLLPEEHYFATVYMRPNVPGGYNPRLSNNNKFKISNSFWLSTKEGKECQGKGIHSICVVESGDIKRILRITSFGERALFQNKYHMENDPFVMDCMEERIIASNKMEYAKDLLPSYKSSDR